MDYIIHKNKKYILDQEAYIEGIEGLIYTATATSEDGDQVKVEWDVLDDHLEKLLAYENGDFEGPEPLEEDACDWQIYRCEEI